MYQLDTYSRSLTSELVLNQYKPNYSLRLNSLSSNTIKSYLSDLSFFLFWFTKTVPNKDDNGKTILLSSSEIASIIVNNNINGDVLCKWLEDNGFQFKLNTIKRKLAAISWCLRQLELKDSTKDQSVRDSFKGLARLHAQYVARQITRPDIESLGITPPTISSELLSKSAAPGLRINAILKVFDFINDNKGNLGHNRVIRDKALISLWWAGAFRRSEIATLQWDFIEFVDEGLIITLPISKTDQTGKGITKGIAHAVKHRELCAVRHLQDWYDLLNMEGIDNPFIFMKISHKDNISQLEEHLDSKSIVRILKGYLKSAGVKNPESFSGHSPRRGFVTEAYHAGAPTRSIQKQGGWKSEAMLNTYIEEDNLFVRNATSAVI